MKVLHVVGFYPEIGGPFTVVKALLTKLQEKGVDIHILSPLPMKYDKNNLKFLNEVNFRVTYVRQELPRWVWPSFSLKFFSFVPKLAKHSDLIHLHGLFDLYSLPVYLSSKKYVLSLHGSFMQEGYRKIILKKLKKDIFMKLLGKRILRKASALHVHTAEEREHTLTFLPELKNKIVVIPNGINLKNFIFEHNKPVIKKTNRILFLGRINWIKGIDILIEGTSKIIGERQDVELVIAGKDDGDGYEKVVADWVKKKGIEKHVVFTGFVSGEEKKRLLHESDVFILPSYSEALPTAVIEAMASGLPVIVSNRVGILREIKTYGAGIIIEPTAEGVYRGLKTLLSMEKEKVNEMRKRARKMVEELYDIDKVADKMLELYEQVLKD